MSARRCASSSAGENGARVEPFDLVCHGVARRKQENGSGDLAPPQLGGDFEAVYLGKHDVEDDDVVGSLRCVSESGRPVCYGIDVVVVLFQDLAQGRAQGEVIFDDKQLHGDPLVAMCGASFRAPQGLARRWRSCDPF